MGRQDDNDSLSISVNTNLGFLKAPHRNLPKSIPSSMQDLRVGDGIINEESQVELHHDQNVDPSKDSLDPFTSIPSVPP